MSESPPPISSDDPIRIPITDTFDLHTVAPRDVKEAVEAYLEEAHKLYDPSIHRALVHQIGIYPQVASQAFFGTALYCLGYPDQALTQNNAAIGEARRLAHPPSLAVGLAIGASFDPELARAGGAMIAAEAKSHGFNVMLAGGADLIRDPRNEALERGEFDRLAVSAPPGDKGPRVDAFGDPQP